MSVHRTQEGAWYVLDANKSSYFGLEACLAFLDAATAPRRTVIVGTISEYPGASSPHYRKVARLVMTKADRAIFVGPNAPHVRKLAADEFRNRLIVMEDPDHLVPFLTGNLIQDEIVYIKATRADHLAQRLVPRPQR